MQSIGVMNLNRRASNILLELQPVHWPFCLLQLDCRNFNDIMRSNSAQCSTGYRIPFDLTHLSHFTFSFKRVSVASLYIFFRCALSLAFFSIIHCSHCKLSCSHLRFYHALLCIRSACIHASFSSVLICLIISKF